MGNGYTDNITYTTTGNIDIWNGTSYGLITFSLIPSVLSETPSMPMMLMVVTWSGTAISYMPGTRKTG